MDDDLDSRPWLTLTEAAAASGKHIAALRALVRRRRIPARKGNNGQWLVQVAVPPGPAKFIDGQAADPAEIMNGHAVALAESDDGPAMARAAVAAHGELVDELRNRISGLEDLLEAERTELKAERRAHLEARDRAATAEGRAQSYLESLQDLATRLDVAHAELALARRSWWRRLFG
jgi:hypothetical protein